MHDKEGNGNGMVAIHRWFAGGEGWAYHPWYEDRKHELLAALKRELESRRELESSGGHRQFVWEAMGGVLFGEQTSDSSCQDEAATGRYPTILRAVFLRAKPSEADGVPIGVCLSKLDPKRAGPDSGLHIRVNEPASAVGVPRSRNVWQYIALLGFLLAGAAIAWSQVGFFPPKEQPLDDELRKAHAKMSELLEKWQVKEAEEIDGKDAESVYKTARNFLSFLSQKELKGRLDGGHPDSCFAKRLPVSGANPRKADELRRNLEGLTRHLTRNTEPTPPEITPAKHKPLDATLEEIDQQMSFTRWWKKDGSHLAYAAGEKADSEVSRFAYRFIVDRPVDRANRVWQKSAAEKMVSMLRGSWKIEAVTETDCSKRPWLVFHCFFQLLSQRQFRSDDLREDAWQVEFVKRLPKEPYTKDGEFTREQELIDSLRKLARDVGAEESDNASTLVTNIAKRMNYTEWKREANSLFRREQEKGSPAVERFVQRFISNP